MRVPPLQPCVHCKRPASKAGAALTGKPMVCDGCTESFRVTGKPLEPIKSSKAANPRTTAKTKASEEGQ